MNLRHHFAHIAVSGVVALALCTTAAASERRTANTLMGAGLGAVAGAVLSDGDPLLTLGSAAAGGLLGNVLTEDRHHHSSYRHDYRPSPRHVDERFSHGPRHGYSRGGWQPHHHH